MQRSEFQFIDHVRSLQPSHPAVETGIGDDAAILSPSGDKSTIIATDLLLDEVHFRLSEISPELAGRKALAVNLSDLAAMGATAQTAFVSLMLPDTMPDDILMSIWSGLQALADKYQVAIAGGDTNVWQGQFGISVTVTGVCPDSRPICRNGANNGDWIFVTGELGGSILGRHLTFEPRLHESRWLIREAKPSSMIDISDGLAADLHHVLEESQVGADINADRLPIHPDVFEMSGSPLLHALSDGEDFELLFTVPETQARELVARQRSFFETFNCHLTHIGTIREQHGCTIHSKNGAREELPAHGWVHGRSSLQAES